MDWEIELRFPSSVEGATWFILLGYFEYVPLLIHQIQLAYVLNTVDQCDALRMSRQLRSLLAIEGKCIYLAPW